MAFIKPKTKKGTFQAVLVVKNLPATQETQQTWFNPWVGRIPWRRKWQPTLVLLTGKSHGQRSLAGYSPWGHKESDMTEQAHTEFLCSLML